MDTVNWGLWTRPGTGEQVEMVGVVCRLGSRTGWDGEFEIRSRDVVIVFA